MDPDEITVTGTIASFDPSRTIEPLPNCFSIWPRVSPRVRARSFSSMMWSLRKVVARGNFYCNRAATVRESVGRWSVNGTTDSLTVAARKERSAGRKETVCGSDFRGVVAFAAADEQVFAALY